MAIFGGIFLFANVAFAQDQDLNLKIFNGQTLRQEKLLSIVPTDFSGTTRLSLVDLGGDNQKEILVSYGNIDKPIIKIFRNDGTLVNEWQPYPGGFAGEIVVVGADLDNDGKDEIITAPGAGGGPHVKIWDGYGNEKYDDFFALDNAYRQGIEIAAGDIDGDKTKEIIVSAIEGNKAVIKIFNCFGTQVYENIYFELENSFEPMKISTLDLGLDKVEEIIAAQSSGNQPKILFLRRDGTVINQFLAYAPSFGGGVNLTSVKEDNYNLIITGAGFSGGPHIRFFDGFGKLQKDPRFFSYNEKFRGGVNVAWGDVTGDGQANLITLPYFHNAANHLYKYIDIDLSEQKLEYYQAGKLVAANVISSGMRGMETPVGEYSIWQKNPRAYSRKYELYMPYWMSFKPGYGIHELPEWEGGYKEGANHLGIPVSHGCVRLGVGPAEKLYNWADLGTPVFIHE